MVAKKQYTRLESIGVFLPENIITTRDLVSRIKSKPDIDLERLTGIRNRRYRSENETSLFMAIAAARNCLKNSRYQAKDIDLILNASITRFNQGLTYTIDPPLSLWIKKEIGAIKAINYDITNACAGMMTGAYIIENMIKAGVIKNGMVVSGECLTPVTETAMREIHSKNDPQFASLTVGDAGAAFIMDECVDNKNCIEAIEFSTFSKYANLSFGMPSAKNPGVAMYTDSVGIQRAAFGKILPFLENFLLKQNLKYGDFDYVLFHQTSVKTIRKIDRVLRQYFNNGGEKPEFLISVDEYGNTSSTSIILGLYHALKGKKIKAGSRILIISVASGLALGFFSIKFDNLKVDGMGN